MKFIIIVSASFNQENFLIFRDHKITIYSNFLAYSFFNALAR